MDQRLSDNEVRVWHARSESCLDDESRRGTLLKILSASERSRCERALIDRVQRERLLSRALVRCVLSRYADVSPEAWRFRENRFGRPEIVPRHGVPPLRFNVSHSYGVVTAAFTLGHDVGIDVESLSRSLSVDAVSKFLSTAEHEQIAALTGVAQSDALLRIWTLKEAYAKARGMGFSLPFDRFSFAVNARRKPSLACDSEIDENPGSWQFEQFDITPSHVAAVAVRTEGTELTLTVEKFE